MPSFTDLAIALPCDGLEDFPLIVVPNVSATTLDSATLMGWTSKCDALTLEDISDRRQIIDQAAIASEELLNWTSSVSIDLVNDFYALGYC